MIPAALFAALAIARLGAIHAAVFGGFAAASLAQRIEAARPRAIMTASCGIEGSKGPLAYRPLVEGAVRKSAFKPEKVIVWQRDQLRWNQPDKLGGQRNWQRIVKSARMRGIRAAPVPVKSSDALYIIYTSGVSLLSVFFTPYHNLVLKKTATRDHRPAKRRGARSRRTCGWAEPVYQIGLWHPGPRRRHVLRV